jgi:hypothetical protein
MGQMPTLPTAVECVMIIIGTALATVVGIMIIIGTTRAVATLLSAAV